MVTVMLMASKLIRACSAAWSWSLAAKAACSGDVLAEAGVAGCAAAGNDMLVAGTSRVPRLFTWPLPERL